MALVPIISGLVRDNSIVVHEQMCGLARYRMSMVSREWNVYCKDKIAMIKSKKQLDVVIKNNDILGIIKHFNSIDKSDALRISCVYSRMELINILIAKGTFDWDVGLRGACYSGNIIVVELMIAKGASDWGDGLWGACCGGNIKSIEDH